MELTEFDDYPEFSMGGSDAPKPTLASMMKGLGISPEDRIKAVLGEINEIQDRYGVELCFDTVEGYYYFEVDKVNKEYSSLDLGRNRFDLRKINE